MLAGVKSQMSGWLSGGIPGLNRGNTATGEGDEAAGATESGQQATTGETVASAPEHVKDDDASRWVAGYVKAASRILRVPRYSLKRPKKTKHFIFKIILTKNYCI